MSKEETSVQPWLTMIAAYDREFKPWQGRVERIIQRYRDDYREGTTGTDGTRFNILWSNVQTAMPAVYSKVPQPDVSRRFTDSDPVGRVASLILERALAFETEHYPDYTATMSQSVLDRFLGGRGTAWVRYEPHFIAAEQQMPTDGVNVSEDIDQPGEQLDYECAPVDYVHWRDFGHSVARTWEEVTTVWRRVYMGRPALVERFGEELGNKIPLDTTPEEQRKNQSSLASDNNQQALIFEIWDKTSSKALWISKSLGEVLDERDDPLKLENFWPCPRPLYATLSNESLIPTPDFKLYQDQANELDILSDRIDGLIKALQVKGVYDAAIPELARLFTEGTNGSLIPVKNWAAFAEKNGLRSGIDIVDIKPIAEALINAYRAMDQVKAQVYEITGLSDIIRGQSVASETATAQQLKGQYASLRLKAMQDSVAMYATELLRIKAQIMCGLFRPETLLKLSAADQFSEADKQLIDPAMALLKDRVLRNFRVEIAADSLVQMDENAEQQRRVEFLGAVGGFIEKAAGVGAQAPQLVPLLMTLLKFGVTAFKVGKTIEGEIDKSIEALKQQAAQPPPPPPPDPAVIKAQADEKAAQAQIQADLQKNQIDTQADLTKHQQSLQADAQIEGMRIQSAEKIAGAQIQKDLFIAKNKPQPKVQ